MTGELAAAGQKSPGQRTLSLNELRFFLTRAAAGAGAPFGLGEDFAKAAICLAALGIDPAPAAAAALAGLADGNSGTRLTFAEADGVTILQGEGRRPLSALYAGPALADRLAVAAEDGGSCRMILKQADRPALAAAAVAAAGIGAELAIAWPCGAGARAGIASRCGRLEVLAGGGAVDRPGPADMEVLMEVGRNPAAAAAAAGPGGRRLAELCGRIAEEGVTVAAAPWSAVYGHFAKCLVPSSPQSRAAGAGAGVGDND
ncbi:MAG: DUF3726 domain-containing protein [Rhodospirillales bacterium]|nr:DUF3726 domain-containing protein [Rhodospirillales bacterium]